MYFDPGVSLTTFLLFVVMIAVYKQWPRWLIALLAALTVILADVQLTRLRSGLEVRKIPVAQSYRYFT